MQRNQTALEAIGGAKMRNVVVGNHNVARELLANNATKGHESFIPLNKVQGYIIPSDIVKRLKNLTGNKVELAINLVEYDTKFQPAVALLFGSTFVAEDMATAKIIAFDNPFKKFFNCVTLQGDIYRTDGALGGGLNKTQSLLEKVDPYLNHEQQYLKVKNESESLKNKMASL